MENCVVHYPDIEFFRELIPVKLQTFEILLKTKKVSNK